MPGLATGHQPGSSSPYDPGIAPHLSPREAGATWRSLTPLMPLPSAAYSERTKSSLISKPPSNVGIIRDFLSLPPSPCWPADVWTAGFVSYSVTGVWRHTWQECILINQSTSKNSWFHQINLSSKVQRLKYWKYEWGWKKLSLKWVPGQELETPSTTSAMCPQTAQWGKLWKSFWPTPAPPLLIHCPELASPRK